MASALTTYFFVLKQWFLGAFEKLRKATISFVVSFYTSACNNSALTGQIFIKCYIYVFFKNMYRKFKYHYNLTIMTGTLHEDQYTFMIIYHRILLRKETLSDKTCRENQNTYFIFNNILSENRAVYQTMWNNTVQPDSPQMTIHRVRKRLYPFLFFF
jgi:hypothetical protein